MNTDNALYLSLLHGVILALLALLRSTPPATRDESRAASIDADSERDRSSGNGASKRRS